MTKTYDISVITQHSEREKETKAGRVDNSIQIFFAD